MKNDELAEKTEAIAGSTYGPNKQVVHAIANQIRSNGNVIESLDEFAKSTRKTEIIMIALTCAQVFLALTAIIVTVILTTSQNREPYSGHPASSDSINK